LYVNVTPHAIERRESLIIFRKLILASTVNMSEAWVILPKQHSKFRLTVGLVCLFETH